MEVCSDVIAMSYLRPPIDRRFEKRSVDRIVNVATCHIKEDIRLSAIGNSNFQGARPFQVSGSGRMDQGEGCRQTSPENADE